MSIEELRDLRIELGISQREVGKALHYSDSRIAVFELKRDKIPENVLLAYEDFITDCIDERRKYTKSKTKRIPRISENEKCSKKQVIEIRGIRERLRISQRKVAPILGLSQPGFMYKERGENFMRISEYEALKKFYKQEKLKQIFGKNYKEKKQ
ncbi:MAG: helix-turn-helix domain-containing protein [Synergistaceae bacterium]|nr:helix-turn-helix domain-containing protein [Synergistaceae bacterium]